MSFVSELQGYLRYLKSDPNRPALLSEEMPLGLVIEIRERAIEAFRNYDYQEMEYTDIEEFDNGEVPDDLRSDYRYFVNAGIKDFECIRRVILWRLAENYLSHEARYELTQEDKYIYFLCREFSFNFQNQQEQKSLLYASRNLLCRYDENRWAVTDLGETFIRLPELQATRFLLALETALSPMDGDQWHIPTSFLKELLETGIAPKQEYGYTYEDRITKMGLATAGSSSTLALSPLGKSIIQSVLAKDGVIDALIQFYIHEELIGSASSRLADKADFERYKQLIVNSSIVGDQREAILVEVERLLETDIQYLSIFKSLAPCIEGILKNIIAKENLPITQPGINAAIKGISNAAPPILRAATLEMIDTVFRPYRNIVEHGIAIAPEPARMLCAMTLSLIEQIHLDYYELRKV